MPLSPIPQSGRVPLPSPEAQAASHAIITERDLHDPFAADAHDALRALGQRALRRTNQADRVNDGFALGDLCARLSWVAEAQVLRVFYVGKALLAYHRAAADAANTVDRRLAERAAATYTDWLTEAALAAPTARNLAVALWALADGGQNAGRDGDADESAAFVAIADLAQADSARRLLDAYRASLPESHVGGASVDSADAPGTHTDAQADLYLTASDDLAAPLTPPSRAAPDSADTRASIEIEAVRGEDSAASRTDRDWTRTMEVALTIAPDVNSLPDASRSPIDLIPIGQMPALPTAEASEEAADEDAQVSASTSDDHEQGAPHAEDSRADSHLHTLGDGLAEPAADVSAEVPRAVRMTQTAEMAAVHVASGEGGEFAIGQRIGGRYEVADVKRGGMGIVYLCYDHTERNTVAIKSFQSRFLQNRRAVARFEQEALTWIRLEKHPHIVYAKLVQNIAGRPHIMLEHISGPEGLDADLKSWIARRRLTPALAVEFALHIALGMAHAVARVPGLIHRDLKPANILVTHDSLAKVTDFGLARLARSLDEGGIEASDTGELALPTNPELTRAGAQIGTPAYMSPEQCAALSIIDLRADIYAFGCVLFEMLTGRHLFRARKFEEWMHAHQRETPVFPASAHTALPAPLTALVLRCVAKTPDERPASWDEVTAGLLPLYETLNGAPFTPVDASRSAMVMRDLVDKGYSLTELGHYDEALTAYDRAVALDPNSSWAWARRGRTLRLLERYPDALSAYDEALQIQPRYAWAWKGKGIVFERMGQVERALEAYRLASEYDPLDAWNWYNQADALLTLGDSAGALGLIERALAVDARHAHSWGKLGQIERQRGRFRESAVAYLQAVTLAPDYAWAYNGYGLALKALGQMKEAVLAFKRAARYGPNEFWHHYNIAETLVDLGQHAEAVAPARQATQVQPNNPAGWAKLGQVLRYTKRYLESLQAYNHALDLQPENAWALNGKGMVFETLNRHEDALAAYMEAAAVAPNDAWTWYNAGNLLVQMNRHDEAAAALHRAIALRPEHARSWARLGAALRGLKQPNAAVDAFTQAAALDAHYAWPWSELGSLYESQGRFADAMAAFQRASEIAPRDVNFVQQQADVLLHLDHAGEALTLIDGALGIDAANARLHAKRGQILRRLGQYDEALRAYRSALDLDATYGWAWNGRGMALAALDRHEEALPCFRKAIEYDGGDVWYWYNYGESLVALNRHREAAEALEKALALKPDHAESWAKLGQARRRLNQHEAAVTAYDRALALDPQYAWAWNGRAMSLEALGKREEARASYEQALREDDGVVWYYTNYFDLLISLNQLNEALALMDRALARLASSPSASSPSMSQLYARRGQVLRRRERYREAVEAYVRAVALDAAYAWAWNGLGLAYLALQQPGDARDALAESVRHNPKSLWFWINYGDALLTLDECASAADAYGRALAIRPGHEVAQRKLRMARECL